MFFNSPRKIGQELASVFRQMAVPAFHGTDAMREAELSGNFKFPAGFFRDDYCLGFLFGSFDIYIFQTAAQKWANDKQQETMFHAAHHVNGEPETWKSYVERRQSVLPNEAHPLNLGHEHGATLAATTLQIIRPQEYDTNPALIDAVEKVNSNGINFTTSKHEEVCFYLFTGTFKAYVDANWSPA